MSEQGVDAPPAVTPGGLWREVHGFLSREAPFLIPSLPATGSDSEIEAALQAAADELYRGRNELAAEAHHPGVTHGRSIGEAREDLRSALAGFFERWRIRQLIRPEERLEMYRAMLLTRALDDELKRAFDRKDIVWEGHPSPQKGFRSTGQEAIVGAALRLRRPPAAGEGDDYRGDYVSPLIRDLGVLLMFMDDPEHVLRVQAGKDGTPVGGRDLHTGDFDRGVLPPAAPLAIAAQTLVGMAYGFKLRQEDRVCVAFIGDGGSSLGEWHEAVNFAAVQKLGVVFVVENNQWALGTHVSEQSAARRFALKAPGYGIPGITIFGNDPDEVAAGVTWAAERARSGDGPTLVEVVSYRRSGHAHHDDDRFHGSTGIPGYEFDGEAEAWAALDPIALYERRLHELGLVSAEQMEEARRQATERVAAAAVSAAEAPWPSPGTYRAQVEAVARPLPTPEPADKTRSMAYDEAVRQALIETMEDDEDVFVVGEDVGGRYGGAFGVTRGLAKRFGSARCLNTPLAESAIVGCGVGSALVGLRPVVEMQFADFLAPGFNALVNNAAKVHWRWGRPVPLVVRLPYGGATGTMKKLLGGGPFHSQCPEMWFVRTPGWKVVAPATPADAKGLMISAIQDDNPVIFLEAKGLYGFFRQDLREEVPVGVEHATPIGSATVRRTGDDLSILTYGAMVWTALEAADELAGEGVEADVVDLRSLWPLDEETVFDSVKKTGRALIVHEDTRRGGFGGELAARLVAELFYFLDAPIRRVTAPDTPVPYSPPLEHDFLPKSRQVVAAAQALVAE